MPDHSATPPTGMSRADSCSQTAGLTIESVLRSAGESLESLMSGGAVVRSPLGQRLNGCKLRLLRGAGAHEDDREHGGHEHRH